MLGMGLSTRGEIMDWENVIDWKVVDRLTDEQVSAILDMFDK